MRHNSNLAKADEPAWTSIAVNDLPKEAFADYRARTYPHHWIVDGKMFLHTGGLNAAIAKANADGATPDVMAHLARHRAALPDDLAQTISEILNVATKQPVDIRLYDEIADGRKIIDEWEKDIEADTPVNIHIHSPGGSVYEAILLYNWLKQRKAATTAIIDGIAASAATIVMLGADKVKMFKAGALMIHMPFSGGFGTADDMEKVTRLLSFTEEGIIDIYVAKTGIPAENIREMMDAEQWLDANAALGLGFIDEIVVYSNNKIEDMPRFENVPQDILNTLKSEIDKSKEVSEMTVDIKLVNGELAKAGVASDFADIAAIAGKLKDADELKGTVDDFLKAHGFESLTAATMTIQQMLAPEKAKELQDKLATMQAERLVDELGKGKVTAAFREHAIAQAKASPEAFKKWAEAAPVIVPQNEGTPEDKGTTSNDGKTVVDGVTLPPDMTVDEYRELVSDYGKEAVQELIRDEI